eukprot:jgi/Tetstr1/442223/TSEL_003179.t1
MLVLVLVLALAVLVLLRCSRRGHAANWRRPALIIGRGGWPEEDWQGDGCSVVLDLLDASGHKDDAMEAQLSQMILAHGGELAAPGAQHHTHVVCSNMEQPVAQAALASGRQLVSEFWVHACCRFQTRPSPEDEIFWKPRPHSASTEGAEQLLVCITGFTGMERRMLSFACQWIGFRFEAQLSRATTHLLTFKQEGAKYDAALRWGAESVAAGGAGGPHAVNHRWLIDCLSLWRVLPADPYKQHSGEVLLRHPHLLPPPDQLHNNQLASLGSRSPEGIATPEALPGGAEPPAAGVKLEGVEQAAGGCAKGSPGGAAAPASAEKENEAPGEQRGGPNPNPNPANGVATAAAVAAPPHAPAPAAPRRGSAPCDGSAPSGPSDSEAFLEAQRTTGLLVDALDPLGTGAPAPARLPALLGALHAPPPAAAAATAATPAAEPPPPATERRPGSSARRSATPREARTPRQATPATAATAPPAATASAKQVGAHTRDRQAHERRPPASHLFPHPLQRLALTDEDGGVQAPASSARRSATPREARTSRQVTPATAAAAPPAATASAKQVGAHTPDRHG